MHAVDHQPLRNACLLEQGGEDPIEHPKAAPPDEAVVEGLVGTVTQRGILSLQAVADHVHDAADDTTIVNTSEPARSWELRSKPFF